MASPNVLVSEVPPEGFPRMGSVTLESLQSLATASALDRLNETVQVYEMDAVADQTLLPNLEKQGDGDLPKRQPDKSGGPIEKAGEKKGGDNNGGEKKGGK